MKPFRFRGTFSILVLLLGCVSSQTHIERGVASNSQTRIAESLFEKIFRPGDPNLNSYQDLVVKLTRTEAASAQSPLSDRTACLNAMTPYSRSPAGREKKVDLTHPRALKVYQIHSRPIYTGFVERKNVVEVISWNDETIPPRYEFLLVKDIGIPGKKAQITHANRTFCTSCHQQGGPIFPVLPWSEFLDVRDSRANSTTMTDMLQAFGRRKNYFGVDLKDYARRAKGNQGPDDHDTPEDNYKHPVDLIGKYDNAVRSGNHRLEAAYMCTQLCKDNVECKRLLLKTAVYDTLGQSDSFGMGTGSNISVGNLCPKSQREERFTLPETARSNDWEKQWEPFHDLIMSDRYPAWPDDVLADRDPIQQPIDELTESQLSASSARSKISGGEYFDPGAIALSAFKCLGLSGDDRMKLMNIEKTQILTRVRSRQATKLLSAPGLPLRENLMNLLLGREVAQAEVHRLPADEDIILADRSDPAYLVVKHCSQCHGHANDEYPLPLSDLNKMRLYASPIFNKTPYELVSIGEMPRKKLPDFDEERQKLLEVLAPHPQE